MFTLNDDRIPTNFDEAADLLRKQGTEPGDRWKVTHNTWLYDGRQRAMPSIGVILHNTEVVTYYRNGRIVLNTGGYGTALTMRRINLFTPVGVRVWQHDWTLRVADQYGEREFEDGMIVVPSARSPFVDA